MPKPVNSRWWNETRRVASRGRGADAPPTVGNRLPCAMVGARRAHVAAPAAICRKGVLVYGSATRHAYTRQDATAATAESTALRIRRALLPQASKLPLRI